MDGQRGWVMMVVVVAVSGICPVRHAEHTGQGISDGGVEGWIWVMCCSIRDGGLQMRSFWCMFYGICELPVANLILAACVR